MDCYTIALRCELKLCSRKSMNPQRHVHTNDLHTIISISIRNHPCQVLHSKSEVANATQLNAKAHLIAPTIRVPALCNAQAFPSKPLHARS